MFKPNSHLRLSSTQGRLAVNQSLIELSQTTVCWLSCDVTSFDGYMPQLQNEKRESLKTIGSQLNSYLSWFALSRQAQDVKQE